MISVCILTKNSASTLCATLDSLKSFQEIVILDNGSQDETLTIAKKYPNTVVYQAEFTGFGAMRNLAANLARYDWVLALDSDEALSPALSQEIRSLHLDPLNAYQIDRQNFFNNRQIKGCGWGKDQVARLYCRKNIGYCTSLVHESLRQYPLKKLKAPLYHTPYLSIGSFLQKMHHYSELFAEQNKGKKTSSLAHAILHSFFAFFKSYFLKRGFLDGKEGLIISCYNAHTAWYKYLLLAEKNKDF